MHAPHLVARDRVGEVGDPFAWLAMNRDVVDRQAPALGPGQPQGRQSSTSKSLPSARSKPVTASSRSTAAKKPMAPKFTPNTGTRIPA